VSRGAHIIHSERGAMKPRLRIRWAGMLIAACALLTGGYAQAGEATAEQTGGVGRDGLDVASISSFYIGGHQVELSGLPTRTIVFSPGEKPTKVNPNGTAQPSHSNLPLVPVKPAHPALETLRTGAPAL